jgi:voltage-gated potassium channel Kch
MGEPGRQGEGPRLSERARYLFDKSMSAGTVALIGWLAALSLAIIIVASVFIVLVGIAPEGEQRPHDFVETGWESLMRTLDSGTVGGDSGWPYRIVMLVVTIAGIFVFSALIGVLSTGLEAKIAELRKGRSRVLEEGHTILLNWSPSLVDILSELAMANTGDKTARIVILAERDKVEMEDEIAAKAPKLKRVEVICRSGDPCDLNDLSIVNPGQAKSIIVLAPEGDDPDSQVIKTILAVTNGPERGAQPMQVVAEIRDARNIELARTVGGDEVQVVLADDLISRILVQSTRQSGLSGVFAELLSFEGNEIHTRKVDGLAGMTFGEALGVFEEGALLGLADKEVQLNPPMETVIGESDKAVVVAVDDLSIRIRKDAREAVDVGAIRDVEPAAQAPRRVLMLGWNRRASTIAYELSRYTLPGSALTIVADAPQFEGEVARIEGAFANLKVTYQVSDTTREATLKPLDVTSFDHVIVLGYTDNMPAQSADTRTLVTLLQLRKLGEAAGAPVNVVSEMLDARNRALAEVTRADDFVVSNQLVSMMLAQASENKYISAIFADLLDEEGSEVYVRPITDYVAIDRPVSFYTIIEAARRRGEVAFGHKISIAAGGDRKKGGVVVNPPRHEVRMYAASDAVVVLARG